MHTQHLVMRQKTLVPLLCLVCIFLATSCGTVPPGGSGQGGDMPIPTTQPTPTTAPLMPTPTVDLAHARKAFDSGGELTYQEVIALRREIVGDPEAWHSIKDHEQYYKAQEEFYEREQDFGKKLEKCKLKETIGWVAWSSQVYDADYKDIPDKHRLALYLYNPFYGSAKDVTPGWDSYPEMFLVYFTDKEIAHFIPGQRLKFSGDLLLVDEQESVTNVKFTLLDDDPPVPAPTADELKDLSITLERTMCFGSCPDYALTIEPDGKVTFNGRHYTQTKGTATTTFDRAKLLELATEIKRADFFSLDTSYSVPVTDNPTYILTVQMGGQSKRVESYATRPHRLGILMNRIDQIVNTDQWIGNSREP